MSVKREFLASEFPPEPEVQQTGGQHSHRRTWEEARRFRRGLVCGKFLLEEPALKREFERFEGSDYVYPGYSYKLCMAKAITGGVSGMGAVIATRPLAKSMERDGAFYSTYGWHPRSVQAAIATLTYIRKHKNALLQHVAELSECFRMRLARMQFKHSATLRIRGLAIGVDFENEDYASRAQTKCRRNGMLATIEETTLLLLPAQHRPKNRQARAGDTRAVCLKLRRLRRSGLGP